MKAKTNGLVGKSLKHSAETNMFSLYIVKEITSVFKRAF